MVEGRQCGRHVGCGRERHWHAPTGTDARVVLSWRRGFKQRYCRWLERAGSGWSDRGGFAPDGRGGGQDLDVCGREPRHAPLGDGHLWRVGRACRGVGQLSIYLYVYPSEHDADEPSHCSWIERLRVVGLDRQRQRQAAADAPSSFSPPAPSSAAALPAPDSAGGSPPTAHSSTFDSGTSSPVVAGTKRRRATATSNMAPGAEVEGLAASNGRVRATGVDAGLAEDEADDSAVSRRKRGAWRESAEHEA